MAAEKKVRVKLNGRIVLKHALISPEIAARLPALYATEKVPTEEKIVQAKLFNPCGAATWWLTEYDPDERLAFGYCDLGMGSSEWGYVSITELESVAGPMGIGIERDIWFEPQPFWRCVPAAVDPDRLAELKLRAGLVAEEKTMPLFPEGA